MAFNSYLQSYKEFCLFSYLVKLKGYNIDNPVWQPIDFEIEKKAAQISQKYPWVRFMIDADLISKKEICTYQETTLEALNYWGVYTLMIGQSPKLSLNKALTLTSDQASVLDNIEAQSEINRNLISIDDAIKKYSKNTEYNVLRL